MLVRLLNQNLLIGASARHPRVDHHAESKYGECYREKYSDSQPAIAQCPAPIKLRSSGISAVPAFLPSM
jgi:hypothetical protein